MYLWMVVVVMIMMILVIIIMQWQWKLLQITDDTTHLLPHTMISSRRVCLIFLPPLDPMFVSRVISVKSLIIGVIGVVNKKWSHISTLSLIPHKICVSHPPISTNWMAIIYLSINRWRISMPSVNHWMRKPRR